MKKIATISASIAALALIIGGFTVSSNHHALADTYKQTFSASSANSMSNGVFNVAGDEGSIDYSLAQDTSGTLSCLAGSGPNAGSMITVATLSGSGTLTSSGISSNGQYCNPNIFTFAHLIQDMREGKIYFSSAGLTSTMLVSGGPVTPVMSTTTTGTSTTATSTDSTGSGSAGTTGTSTTATSTDSTGTTGGNGGGASTSTSTNATSTIATSTLPSAMTSAANLRVALNNLLREHVSSSLDVLRDIANFSTTSNATSSPLYGSLVEQDDNAVDLATAIGSVYGTNAANQFLTIFRNHIIASNAYTIGLKYGSSTDEQLALSALDSQLQALATFFSTANPNIDNATLLAALRQHEQLINQSSADYIAGDYVDAYAVERQALAQISGGADFLANAIVAQYPNLFSN